MSNANKKGVLPLEYAFDRERKKTLRYRLWRRTHHVLHAIEQFAYKPMKNIIDLGTADGRMLNYIHQKFPDSKCVGVEMNEELVTFANETFSDIEITQGDISSLEFTDNTFDVAIATAVIEHVPDPAKVIKEARRILKDGGIFILTSPDPYWEYIARMVGHLDDEQHNEVLNLSQLEKLISGSGFNVLKTEKFLLSPMKIPFDLVIEKMIRKLKLDFLMANQFIVARK